ncbi:MAG: hypothetical protein WDN28_06790 [Chthoniobacter sp.]
MIDGPPLIGGVALERVEEILLVAAKILDAAALHERDEFRRDRAFAGPQPPRRLAKQPGVLLDRQRELRRRILGPVKALRKFPSGQAALGEGRVRR